jgi:hypothetical protein
LTDSPQSGSAADLRRRLLDSEIGFDVVDFVMATVESWVADRSDWEFATADALSDPNVDMDLARDHVDWGEAFSLLARELADENALTKEDEEE